ncbi:hypothetical protein BV25DRAFT_1821259 [Artomyces pyxidatus]|uniref:Uncharacterized protein n=1 Tax=Artomyces pyxidatus TaxID=48021 RepID=A0ACB8TCZ2_9AGAM|nr:hypothetical protein BV25DRAFT_1821259 [Artomyces pyxidatus]
MANATPLRSRSSRHRPLRRRPAALVLSRISLGFPAAIDLEDVKLVLDASIHMESDNNTRASLDADIALCCLRTKFLHETWSTSLQVLFHATRTPETGWLSPNAQWRNAKYMEDESVIFQLSVDRYRLSETSAFACCLAFRDSLPWEGSGAQYDEASKMRRKLYQLYGAMSGHGTRESEPPPTWKLRWQAEVGRPPSHLRWNVDIAAEQIHRHRALELQSTPSCTSDNGQCGILEDYVDAMRVLEHLKHKPRAVIWLNRRPRYSSEEDVLETQKLPRLRRTRTMRALAKMRLTTDDRSPIFPDVAYETIRPCSPSPGSIS